MRDFHFPGRSAVFADNGMVATSTPLASQVAIDVLKSGGNAVDAAIAGAVLLGLCEPQMTGIGGDIFALVKKPGCEEVVTLNGSGRAPAALTADMVRASGYTETMPECHPFAVTVPGAIDAFCRLSQDYGVKGLDAVLAPAIHYMKAGVPIAPRTASDWMGTISDFNGAARRDYTQNGEPFQTGARFALPRQAEVLEKIAKDGAKAFYEGEIAEDMVLSLRALGGCHTLEDFAAVQSEYGVPIEGTYKGYRMLEHPPNGHGATAILLNNILAQFDLARLEPFGADRVHIEAEAVKLAYDARDRFVADMDYMTRLDHMLNPITGQQLAVLIDPKKAMKSAHKQSQNVHKETIYITVVDKDRMMVSLIYSIFNTFGSSLASEKYGILFHNRGSGFNLIGGHPNEVAGGKRPMHTIIPAILADAKGMRMPFGVMGGAYQANGHGRFVTNIVDFGMDPQSAIDAPRSFAYAGELRMERGFGPKVKQTLADMGHKVVVPPTAIGGAQAIWVDPDNGVLQGASDPRKDGCALGY
ncbi:MAG: gamma-glutamyltransferase family protein [Pseudomonadota bacterium]